MNDAHILKDVLRRFEGQETHTVHLVYTPKNRQQQQSYGPKSSQSVRKDNTTRSQTSQNTQQSRAATTTASDGLRWVSISFQFKSFSYSNGNIFIIDIEMLDRIKIEHQMNHNHCPVL